MPDSQLASERLRDALAVLDFPLSGEARDGLQRLVCAYVAFLKGIGWPPERVIVAVKHLANESGLQASRWVTTTEYGISKRDELLVDMVRWCIEEYYRTNTA